MVQLLLLFLAGIASAAPSVSHKNEVNYIRHEVRSVTHNPLLQVATPSKNSSLPIRIALKQQNLHLLPDYLLSVSDPTSPSYGKHWAPEQVVEAFAPPVHVTQAITDWLSEHGIRPSRVRMSPNKSWLDIKDVTIEEAERFLKTRYHLYKRGDEDEDYLGCDSYSLPREISDLVDFVTPTIHPIPPSKRKGDRLGGSSIQRRDQTRSLSATPLSGCDTAVTPDCLKGLYNITYTPRAVDRNSVGIVSYYSLTYLQSDLDTFFRNFSPSLVGTSPELVSIDGGTITPDETSDFGEDGWILQYLMTLVQSQPVTLLQVGNKQTGETRSFNLWLDAVDGSYCTSGGGDDFTYDPQIPSPFPDGLKEHSCGITKSPYVVSNSQAAYEHGYSNYYLERQCNEFGKLGLMGVTVLYAAGNTGVTGAQSGVCMDEHNTLNYNGTVFVPSWPASCPWVTAVGGTQVKANSTAVPGNEEVWSQEVLPGVFQSGGGGFSNNFPTPKYQKDAVKNYLKKFGYTHNTKFNIGGRAYPDLSANANSFLNVDNGSLSIDSGTSGSTPTVAAIISLVNDARIASGKSPVGFINPAIYSPMFAGAFNDVTSGFSQGCRGLQGERGGGFNATKGWDPASGVGTPDLGRLIETWLRLP